MHMSRISIQNFRNFQTLDVHTGEHLVVVGENRVGKSNLLHALRLILDPSLSERSRLLRLRDRASGSEFIVMTNHLARTNSGLRTQQAIGLREWARDQSTGVINIGDFNMDFDFHTRKGNEAFVEMLQDNVWHWVKPIEFIDTNWADSDGDGNDNYPDSMLDFAFVAGPAKDWQPVCRVIVRDGDFPDDESTSDHRPIELRLTPSHLSNEGR